jgi:hypothetical protein
MLPQKLYELLPYLYILTGIISASLVDSTVVRISSILLILAGVFVFIMRRNYRKSIKKRLDVDQMTMMRPSVPDAYVHRSGIERRGRTDVEWRISAATGDKIRYERRSGERRASQY